MFSRATRIESEESTRGIDVRISIDQLVKTYGGVTALDDVSLEIAPGQIVAIVGANGAGKTTLLRSLAGLAAPTKGEIRYDDQAFHRGRVDLRVRFAFLPDTPCVYPQLTVLRHVAMALKLYGAERPGIEDVVAQLLGEFDLLPLAESPLATLSRGELYKAALVAVLAVDPEVWMFDEPFASGMDPHGLKAFRRHAQAAAARGRTVLYSTQILEVAERFADAVCVLHCGKVRAFGAVDALRRPNGEVESVLESLFAELRLEET
jgi:ABC-type multidrug transport system ATPase subunit